MIPLDKLTGGQVTDFWIVLLAIFAFVILLGNVIKTIKDWRKPQNDLEEWRTSVDNKLRNDNDRLKAMEDGNRVICRGILALLSHEINGNSVEKLKESQSEMTNYLIDR